MGQGNKKKRFLVIGLGRFGTSLAESLSESGHDVVAVDLDMEKVDAIKHRVAFAMQLDATNAAALSSVDAAACEGAIVAIGNDFEAAALCVAALKEAKVEPIVARARTRQQGKILTAIGATRVLEVEAEMARRLGAELA
jgi:trk system potassium uptake protein